LFLDLLATVVQRLHGLPIGPEPDCIQQHEQHVPHEDEEIEPMRFDRLLLVLGVQMAAGVDLVRVLRVLLHEEQQEKRKAEQPSDVGQSIVHPLEGAADYQLGTCPPEHYAGIVIGVGLFGNHLAQTGNNGPRLDPLLPQGNDALVRGDLIVRDEDIEQAGEGGGELHVVAILQVVCDVLG
jgi:hypothetical protein